MHDSAAGFVDVRRQDGIAILTLTRPAADNRITQQMAESGVAALEDARRDRSIAGCVLTGAGNVFCTGGDYRGAGSSSAGRLEFARAHNDLAQAMARLGKPLVAAINGNAHAGGFSLVTLCDLAVCAEHATLGLPEAAHGLFPLLALTIVKDSLPQKVFFDVVYRARLLGASEAQSLHLVNEVVPRARVLERAIELAGSTRHANPDIIGIGRDLYYETRGATPHDANERARFALLAALKALDESGR
ncbi:MAG TPA: enoyl-CoA hydratase/isomerase family protein [Gammaproteobacteria bacterium]|jgi:enoyl-CoA hydratase/carnithine racemase|nr:enoyl-CoA hydratase/isomerase family protein [Gammaproteobacteria bacterium]